MKLLKIAICVKLHKFCNQNKLGSWAFNRVRSLFPKRYRPRKAYFIEKCASMFYHEAMKNVPAFMTSQQKQWRWVIAELIHLLKDAYLLKNFPYPWASVNYTDSIEVCHDDERDLHYVLLNGRRLYYPREWAVEKIKSGFASVNCVEQHRESPHRYLPDEFLAAADDIVVDCGAAEGNFALGMIDKIKKLYLFEVEDCWIEPLEATYAPWRDKVVVVRKFVSDEDSEMSVRLDTYFADKESPTILKLDVEGAEKKVLVGADECLKTSVKNAYVCAYHYHDDERNLTKHMKDCNFDVTPVPGYMLFWMYDEMKPPFFRRGVLRCTKR